MTAIPYYARQNRCKGAMMRLTTPEGAGLPAGAVVEEFPLLVRLHTFRVTLKHRRRQYGCNGENV